MDKFFGLDTPAKLDKDTALLTTTHDDVEKMIICGILEEENIPFLAIFGKILYTTLDTF